MKFLIATLISLAAFNSQAYFTMSRYSVDFWNVKVGDYFGKSETVYVYNRDSKNLSINSYDTCFFDVKVRTLFCNNLAPNMSCELEVQFAPKSAGPMRCNITVYDDSGWQERIYISGNGVE